MCADSGTNSCFKKKLQAAAAFTDTDILPVWVVYGFGNVKIAIDIFCVVFSIILSLIFFDFDIVGTREGTIISAFFTGTFVKLFTKVLHKPISKILCSE